MRYDVFAFHVDFQLASAYAVGRLSDLVDAAWNLDPVAAHDLHVRHESDLKVNVAFIGLIALQTVARKLEACF